MPGKLYKYMRKKYVARFVGRGDVLFRNLTYFRRIEDRGRGDLLESLHVDYPDNPVELQGVNPPFKWVGRAAYLNSVNADRLFIFCLSEGLNDRLFEEFGADACIEISDPAAFLSRAERTIAGQPRFGDSGLLHGPVEYYLPDRAVRGNVKDPKRIPFFKHALYGHQREYRLVVSLRGGFRLLERIVLPSYDLEAEAMAGKDASRMVRLGSLDDIVTVHERDRGPSRAV